MRGSAMVLGWAAMVLSSNAAAAAACDRNRRAQHPRYGHGHGADPQRRGSGPRLRGAEPRCRRADGLITLVQIGLSGTSSAACAAGDLDADDSIDIAEVITAVANALNGCP